MSELFFQLKQAFDEFIVKALSVIVGEEWARLVGVVVSVNVLSGFVSALYAAIDRCAAVASRSRGATRQTLTS